MEQYKKEFSEDLTNSCALFFKDDLFLKDGRPTPYFVNIGNFAKKASLRLKLAKAYAGMIKQKMDNGMNIDIVFGPSYKASLIAGDATLVLLNEYGIDLGCSYDRKEAKVHGEASAKGSVLVGAELLDGSNIYIVDDVGTSMATKIEACDKIIYESGLKSIETKIVGVGIAVDREQRGPIYDNEMPVGLSGGDLTKWKREHVCLDAKGEDAIGNFTNKTGIPVDSIIGIREVVEHLFESKHPLMINDKKQLMNEQVHIDFLEYMTVYGR